LLLFSRRNLRKNILDYLKQQVILQGSNRVHLPISKKEWADSLGVQRPSLFRELKKMREEGLIGVENRIITVMQG
jgi:Mn-dependent DtxR family transcriptional regulator